MPILCEVVSQDRLLYSGEVEAVIAPGAEGQLGILPHHAPLLTMLGIGLLRLRLEGGEEIFTIGGGFMEVLPDRVTVLAEVGENVAEIDIARAERARANAERLLREAPPHDADEYARLEATLRRSNLRLEAARRYRRPGRRGLGSGEGERG